MSNNINATAMNTTLVKYGYVYDDAEGNQKAGRSSLNVSVPNSLADFATEICELWKGGALSDRLLTKITKRAHRVCRKGVYNKETGQYEGALNGQPLRDLIKMFGGKETPALLKPAKARVKKFLIEYCACKVTDDGSVSITPLSPERERALFEVINDPNLTVMTAKFTTVRKESSVYERVTSYLTKALEKAKTPEEQAYMQALIAANTAYLDKANLM